MNLDLGDVRNRINLNRTLNTVNKMNTPNMYS